MEDIKVDQILQYLKNKFVPTIYPPNSKSRKAWVQQTKRKFSLIKVQNTTATNEYLGIKYSRGTDGLGEPIVQILRVPKKSELPELFTNYHENIGHPGIEGTMA